MTRRSRIHRTLLTILAFSFAVFSQGAQAAEREKLLSDPGVYGTFAAFKVDMDWWKLEKGAREAATASVKEVVLKHADHVIVDTYLLRGLSEHADLLLRIHATELVHNQQFLVDFMRTGLGVHLVNTSTFNGLTKKANYVPSFPDDTKASLKTPIDAGAKPYAIVIPIRKDPAWWLMDQETRVRQMKEHTDAAIPYLKTIQRKLYHSNGLDDFDFITYFETANLADFNSLILALQQVKENQHNRRFGNPTLVGTVHPLDDILDVFAR
jgi:chlorite dismutase